MEPKFGAAFAEQQQFIIQKINFSIFAKSDEIK